MKPNSNLDDFVEWDIPNWSVALDFWRKHTQHRTSSLRALEIGCGRGGLSLWLALNGLEVLCTDLKGVSQEAIKKHTKYEVIDRIKYETLDALDIPYSEEFDIVLFKSVLGGIGRYNNKQNQIRAICEIHKSLKKSGELWFAENLVGSPFHQFFRHRYVNWGKSWRYVSIQEMGEFLSIFSEIKYITVGFLGAFGRTESQRFLLGKMDRLIVDKLVPRKWHYIMIGIAHK